MNLWRDLARASNPRSKRSRGNKNGNLINLMQWVHSEEITDLGALAGDTADEALGKAS